MTSLFDQLRGAARHRLIDIDLKQVDLAERMGISAKHVNCFLTGKFGMTVEMLDRLAEAVGCEWEVRLVPTGQNDSSIPNG